jgi:S-formylglutathione hydrolase FrmB
MSPPQGPSRSQIRRRRRVALAALLAATVGIAYLLLQATILSPADTHGARVEHLTVHSDAVGEGLEVDVVIPPGDHSQRPLLIFLHGRGGSNGTFTEDEAMFAALARLGELAPIIAFPDGHDHSYWHDRDGGDWGEYVIEETIPLVIRETGADAGRVAIGGISMGGFGAYDLALLNPRRFCAVGGHSPALWLEGGASAPGAFDDAEDFERHDVIAAVRADPSAFGAIPIWNDAGDEDPFLISDVAFTEALEADGTDLTAHVWPGDHDRTYWDRHWDEYFRFYAMALADC